MSKKMVNTGCKVQSIKRMHQNFSSKLPELSRNTVCNMPPGIVLVEILSCWLKTVSIAGSKDQKAVRKQLIMDDAIPICVWSPFELLL